MDSFMNQSRIMNEFGKQLSLQFRVLDIDPDLVIIYIGGNDILTRLVVPSAYSGDNSGSHKKWESPHIPFFEYSTLLRIISRKFRLTHQVGVL